MKILTELKQGPKDKVEPPVPPSTSLPHEAASSRPSTPAARLEPDLIPSDQEDLEVEKDKLKKYLEENKQKKEEVNQSHHQVLQLLEKEGGWAAMLAAIVELAKKIQDTDFKAVLGNFATAVHNIKCKPGEELEYQGIDKWQNNAGQAQTRLDEIENRLKGLKNDKPSSDKQAATPAPKATAGATDAGLTAPIKPPAIASLEGGSALAAGGVAKPVAPGGTDPSSTVAVTPPKAP